MNSKLIAIVSAFAIVGMFGAFAFLGTGAGVSYGDIESANLFESASTINLTGVTDTITDLFTELIPLVAIMSILGGLMRSLPKMFKFD